MRYSLFHILLLFVGFAAQAQHKQYVFTRLTSKEGLNSNHVYSILQDKRGFMWFATVSGLQRYDGRKIISFKPGPWDTAYLPAEPVTQIFLDTKDRFWVRIGKQAGIFNPATFAYKRIDIEASANSLESEVRLWPDREGNVFASVSKYGMLVYNEKKQAFVKDPSIIDIPENVGISTFQQDPVTGNYWIGTSEGLVLFDRKQKKYYTHNNNPFKNPILQKTTFTASVTSFLIDSQQRLWIGTWPMPINSEFISCYDPKTRKLNTPIKVTTPEDKYRELHFFRQQRNGNMWVHGLAVLAEYDETTNRFENIYNENPSDYGIRYDVVYDFFEDREQNVWLGTDQGVFVFNPRAQRFTSISLSEVPKQRGLLDRSLTTFLELKNGNIWAGSWGQGVFTYNSKFQLTNNNIYANAPDDGNYNLVWHMLQQSGTNKIWLGCQSGRLMIYDQDRRQTSFINHPVFQQRTIRQLAEDPLGNIWMGTQHGLLVKWNAEKGKKNFNDGFELVHKFRSNVFKLSFDNTGLLWIASELEGVTVMDTAGNVLAKYNVDGGPGKSLTRNGATDFLFYNDTTVIICAAGLNILNRKNGNIQQITAMDGLPSNTVNTAKRDKDGNLWLGLVNGICRFNMKRNIFTLFTQKDGIIQNDFQNGHSYVMNDGRMIFNNQSDFVYFSPEQILPPSIPPDVSITDFKLFNTYLPPDSILALDRIMLNHDQNSITIEFAALSFLQKDKMVYYIKLDGMDEDWTRVERYTLANFSLLPPGDYTFQARCENGDGIPCKNITSLRIHIRPPFWRQEWFIVFCIFAVAGLIYLAHRMRVSQLMEMEKVRGRIARDLHDDMGSTLSTINILSEMARMKVANDTEKTSEYISKISDNSNRMMEAMDDIVWSINPMNDSMQRISARMREFATSVLEARDIEVSFRVDEKVKDLRLDMEARRDFFLIFKEAVNNVAKYSKARRVAIEITVQHSRVVMQIKDDGIGFDVQQADSGNGLNNMKKRAESLKGMLAIESVPGIGTKVRLEAPLT